MLYFSWRVGCYKDIPLTNGRTLELCKQNTERYLSGWDDSKFEITEGSKDGPVVYRSE